MKPFSIFLVVLLSACKLKNDCFNLQKGYTQLEYSLPIKIANDVIDSLHSKKRYDAILNSDTIKIRLMSDFLNDSVGFYFECKEPFKIIKNVSTNRSTMFSNTFVSVNKKVKSKMIITIADRYYEIIIPKEYLFIDLYYNRKNKTLKCVFNNTILILS